MRNIWTIFTGDIRRAGGSVIALIISIGLMLMPSFYAWFNIYGSWDPYSNTGGMKVAVANADKGYQGDMLPAAVNVGDQVVNALRANDDLDWTFVTANEAKDGVRSSEYYAAIVIPKDFSSNVFTLFTSGGGASDSIRHARLVYYSNPKKNPIASTVTNQGASAVQAQVNDTLTSTIATTLIGTMGSVLDYLDTDQSGRSVATLSASLRQESENLASAAELSSSYAGLTRSAASMLQTSLKAMSGSKSSLAGRQIDVDDLTAKLDKAADAIDQTNAGMSAGLGSLADAFETTGSDASAALGKPAGAANDMAARLRAISTDKVRPMITSLEEYRDTLAGLQGQVRTDAAKHALGLAIKDVDRTLAKLEAYDAKLNAAADKAAEGGAAAEQAAKDILDEANASARSIRDLDKSYQTNVVTQIGKVSTSARQTGKDAAALVSDARLMLADVTETTQSGGQSAGDVLETITGTASKLDEAHDTLAEQSGKLAQAADAIDEAMASGGVDQVRKLFDQPADTLAAAMTSPVTLNRKAIFPVANNGSAMAPFYTLMAIWVGVMFLGIIMKPNVSEKTVATLRDPKGWQLYIGRGMTFSLFALAQTTILGLGDLLYLRVQTVNPFLFMLCLWWTAFACSVFIYTLAAVFGNIGKAVSTALMIAQIAGTGGTFPVQMLPAGFREIYPYLPFSHAMTALRETVAGFYGSTYWEQMGRMGIYLAVALLIGIPLYTPISRAMARTNDLVASTGVMG
ncbi:YhgE/Pip domain-containing protein [Bifidobacterium miconisargentati]|uniref:YhgE/Pip domain-containing protein n=1 Tax=Bifidobacterium miconisargentati TaxID=2834437 RepID=UPI001BDC6B04|nr:YhgE/Pip domain-containing protein [Bifidobacterium miconisargentati]MBW3090564.1 YhgE/Pip domain-containing protein [Bifidobacterium miconisargentati]